MMIGCGMVEKLLRRNICLSGLCTLVTLAIHWIEKRGDTALAHLNVTGTYSLTTWSHLGTIFFRQIAMFNSRFHDFHKFSSFFLGGGIYGEAGFIGCMRHITIDGNYKLPSDWKDQEISSRDDIVLESCHVTDRCTPNPCEHAGVCKQNSDEFYCECEGTGYTGAVCHTSLNFLSCVQYSHAHPESRYVRFFFY